jgi:transcriptional regulator with XRE-family HTH domain
LFRHVGLVVRLLRELKGISQAELARQAGLGKSQLSKYEAGRELPKLDSLEKLLVNLGIGVEVFAQVLGTVGRLSKAVESGRASDGPLPLPSEAGGSLMPSGADAAFQEVLGSVLHLHETMVADRVGLGLRFVALRPGASNSPASPDASGGEGS